MKNPTIVCVIGTPRSGTSLTARLLNLAGIYLGPEDGMRPAGDWNPSGFWENRRIGKLNRRLLKALPRNRDASPVPPPDWARTREMEAEWSEARAILDETFAGRDRWGWKEAGTTLVLPFWQQLLPPMRYVICVRNPLDFAAAGKELGGLSRADAYAIWQQHVAAALAHTAGSDRMLVAYDDYLIARRSTIERLWRFAGNRQGPSDAEAKRLEDAVDDNLLHRRSRPQEAIGDRSIPRQVRALYLLTELLRQKAPKGPGESDRLPLDAAVGVHANRVLGEKTAPTAAG